MLITVCGTFKFFFDESDLGSGESQGPSACFSAKYCVRCGWGLSSLSHPNSGRGLLAKFLGFRKGTSIGFVLNSDKGKTFGFAKLTFRLQMQSIKLEYYKI